MKLGLVGAVTLVAPALAMTPVHAGIGAPITFDTSGRAALHEPYGLTADSDGNVYVADTGDHHMVKFNKDGTALLIFGQGDSTTSGQEGKLYYPADATYANDNIYVVDASSKVNVFTTSGLPVTQFPSASDPQQLNVPLGIAADCAGNIYVADSRDNRVVEFDGNGKFLRLIGVGKLAVPSGIAFDEVGGNGSPCGVTDIYVSDEYNNDIVEFQGNGQFVKNIGGPGSGQLQFGGPEALGIEHEPQSGNETMWVSESGNFREQELVTTDGGANWSFSSFLYPEGKGNARGDTHALALESDGSLVVADQNGSLYDYPIKPPALKLSSYADHRSHIRDTGKINFQVKYNQFEKTCTVRVAATVEVPNHAFTIDKRVDDVGDTSKIAGLPLTDQQLSLIEKRWKSAGSIPVSATARGICSDNVHARGDFDFRI